MRVTVTFELHVAQDVRDELAAQYEQVVLYEDTPESRQLAARLLVAVQALDKELPAQRPSGPRKERYGVYERRVVRIVREFSRDRTPMVEFILDGETYQTSVGLVGELE